jgi:hypothetical protein
MGVCHKATVRLLFPFGKFTFRHPFSLTGAFSLSLPFLLCEQSLKLERKVYYSS